LLESPHKAAVVNVVTDDIPPFNTLITTWCRVPGLRLVLVNGVNATDLSLLLRPSAGLGG